MSSLLLSGPYVGPVISWPFSQVLQYHFPSTSRRQDRWMVRWKFYNWVDIPVLMVEVLLGLQKIAVQVPYPPLLEDFSWITFMDPRKSFHCARILYCFSLKSPNFSHLSLYSFPSFLPPLPASLCSHPHLSQCTCKIYFISQIYSITWIFWLANWDH